MNAPSLPDIAAQTALERQPLDGLGMCGIALPLLLDGQRVAPLLERPALVSPLAGWKPYPFEIGARLYPWGFHVELRLQLAYSSTCPCSAALARQLIQQRFAADFAGRAPTHAEVMQLGRPTRQPAVLRGISR